MDKFDRHKAGDRYSSSSEEPHHYSLSGRHSRGGGPPFNHRQENYRGGGGGRDSPHNYRSGFSSGGGRGSGGRESHRPFDSPPRFPPPPTADRGVGSGGLRTIDDGIEGFHLAVGAGEGFGSMSVSGGRGFLPVGGGVGGGFLPVGGGVGGGFRHMNADRGSEVDEFPRITGSGGAGRGFGSMSGRGNASEGFRPLSGGGIQPIGAQGMDAGAFLPMGAGGNDGGGLGPIGSNRDAGGFQPIGAGGSDGERYGLDDYHGAPPLAGQKRGYPFSGRERSPERGGGFAKLFVGSVPRTANDEDIRPLFEKHGCVLEVALIKDKRTGQQQGCCFVKYASSEEADRAIRALHNQYTLPGGVGPIQVRYADGERERLGATEYKLFVGSLNRQATEKEVEEIFSPYGRVEDVYIMRDEMKQSRGCGFVKYSQREMAQAAINALNGAYTMRGCNQPLIVRFADPKRPRPGESRGGAPLGGPGFAPHFPASGIRPLVDHGEPLRGPVAPWPHPSTQNLGPAPNVGDHGFGSHFPSRSGEMAISTARVSVGGLPSNADNLLTGSTLSSASASHLILNKHVPQGPAFASKLSPVQRPLQSPQHLPSLVQLQGSHMQPGQMQIPQSSGETLYGQVLSSQQLPGQNGQLSVHQTPLQHSAQSTTGQASVMANQQLQHSAQSTTGQASVMANQQLPSGQQLQPLSQSPSQLAQLLSQQKQTLQATFQSSQQTLNQLQQQVQQLQPSNKNLTSQGPVATKHQPAVNAHGVQPGDLDAAASSLSNVLPVTPTTTVSCNWTEHTSPDGYKYYYNSLTGESKWEKPEELTLYEQLQQKPSNQHPQVQPHPQGPLTQQAPQMQVQYQGQHQLQLHSQTKALHQSSQSSYQVPGLPAKQVTKDLGYVQIPTATGSVNDLSRYQQGGQPSQEWMWKNKYSGT